MRADRLISILILLQTRGKLTARDLASQLEVSERTIYRDMDALSAAGIPVYCERGPGGGCALLESYRTNLTGLTRDEVRALFMLSIPAPLQQLGVDQDLRAALRKLTASLPEIMRPEGSRSRARIHLDSTAWVQADQSALHLGTIQKALWTDQYLDLTYHLAFGAQTTHRVAPYGLVAKENQWHLVFARQDSLLVKKVSDVMDARLSGKTFSMPADFNLVEFWSEWTLQRESNRPQFLVQVRISPLLLEALLFFKNPILPEDFIKPRLDDKGWYPLTISFDNFEQARKRLLNFGGGVEILAPTALRESVIDFARQTLSVYTP